MKVTKGFLIVAALIITGAVTFLAIRSCKKQADLVTEHETVFTQKVDSTQYYKDAAGREHATRLKTEASLATLQTYYRQEIDSITRALNIKSKQLQEFITASTKTTGSVRVQIDTFYTDTTALYRFAYSDPWLKLDGVLDDDLFINYSFEDSLIITSYWKRKWFLGKKQNYVDGYSLNPAVKITGISAVKVGAALPGRIGIGPFVGYGYTGRGWVPVAGVALHYSLIRF